MSEMKCVIETGDVINVNLTYGLAVSLQRAFKNLVQHEENERRVEELKQGDDKIASTGMIGKTLIGALQRKVAKDVRNKQLGEFLVAQ